MKIKEFSITRYGPLPNTGRILLNDFNLFFGKNEDGKTLTIDALVKLLLGRNTKDFEHIERVDETPEGYVIISDDKGKEIKLPEKGDLTKVANLTPSECRNIFIVRNSNLSIARDVAQESEFYTNVTDRLTGLRTKEISMIRENLIEIGKITPTGIFRDIKGEKLKIRVKSAKDLIKKIESLGEKIKKDRFDELEKESVRQKEEIEGIEQETKSLEDARKREKYEKGKESLNKLREDLEELKGLEIYNESDEQLWREYERDIRIYDEERKKYRTEIQKKEEAFKKAKEKLDEVEREFNVFEDRKKKIDDQVKPELKNYEIGVGKVKSEEIKNRFYTLAAIISAVLLSISMLGVILNPSPILYGLLGFSLISTIIFAALIFSFIQKKSYFEYQKKYDESQDIKWEKEMLEREIKELRDKTIPDIEKRMRNAEEKIEEIKRKSKEETLEDYTKKLKSKQEFEGSKGQQESVLESHFGKKSKKLEENISYWDEEISKLEKYKDKANDIKYSETTISELERRKREFERGLKEANNKMASLQKEIGEVEQKANEILRLEEEYSYCKTSVDLEAIKDKLQGFIDENERNKDNVLEVLKIFEEIEAEEKEKVSELFGKESPISKYFNEITDGLYKEVTFNQKTEKIEVKRTDGKILGAEKLSEGAYDQLYFSIRLALGEKLLKGKKGFFIMDDPFIKADPDRLLRQIKALKKIFKLGWQVIYFSAKGEINDVLKEDIDSGTINYIKLQGIFS